MLAILLLLAVSADACGELCHADAVEQYARLNVLTALARSEEERAAFLVRLPDGGLRAIDWPPGVPGKASYSGHIPPRCVAIIHTHPRSAPQPSWQDLAEAKRTGIPIVVITPQSVTEATTEGTIVQLLDFGWTHTRR